jgi:hydrogenase maturation protease
MKHTVVLGIGNRLMGDDGIGVRVVEALGQGNRSGKIRFAAGETDIDYCLNELAEAEVYVIIDGGCSGREPCSVDVIDLKEVFAQIRPALSFHDFDLIHAMKRENMIKEGILITIEVSSVGFSTELSHCMKERFEEIAREVKGIIVSYINGMDLTDRIS